jgi:hypothetical protein
MVGKGLVVGFPDIRGSFMPYGLPKGPWPGVTGKGANGGKG